MARENLDRLGWVRYYAKVILENRDDQSGVAVALAAHVMELDEEMKDGIIPRDWIPI